MGSREGSSRRTTSESMSPADITATTPEESAPAVTSQSSSLPSDQDRIRFRHGLTESQRSAMLQSAANIAAEIEASKTKKEEEEREKQIEREIRARAAERRIRGLGDANPGTSAQSIRELPRIPRKAHVVRCKHLLYAADDDDDSDVIQIMNFENIDEEQESNDCLFQDTAVAKLTAAVPPHSNKELFATVPIDTRMAQEPLEWDRAADQLPPSTGAIPRRTQSEPRRPVEEPTYERIAGPPGVPGWQLKGSRDSAPGEGRHRKKNKPYNPARQWTIDDIEFFALRDPNENLEELAVAVRTPKPAEQPAPATAVEMLPTTAPKNKDGRPGQADAAKVYRVSWADQQAREGMDEERAATSQTSKPNLPNRRPIAPTGPDREPFGLLFTPTSRLPYDERDAPLYSCFNCWSEEHTRQECPAPKRRFCRNCGRRGVEMADCQRCGPEYPAYRARERIRKNEQNRRYEEEGRRSSRAREVQRRPAPLLPIRALSETPRPLLPWERMMREDARNARGPMVPMTIYRNTEVIHIPAGGPTAARPITVTARSAEASEPTPLTTSTSAAQPAPEQLALPGPSAARNITSSPIPAPRAERARQGDQPTEWERIQMLSSVLTNLRELAPEQRSALLKAMGLDGSPALK